MTTPRKYTETELIALLKQKDKAAISHLYDTYSASLYCVALRILNHDENNAQEILQEVFVNAWKNVQNYDPANGTIFTWLLKITRNTAINKLKTLKLDPIQSIRGNVHNKGKQHQLVTSDVKMEEIEEGNSTNSENKNIVDSVYFSGCTQEEVSKELNLPIASLREGVRKALIEFRNNK